MMTCVLHGGVYGAHITNDRVQNNIKYISYVYTISCVMGYERCTFVFMIKK